MEDKNLQDLKIDDIESSKKTPLKNILTLLALLFIILVISVVITKLILNTDDGHEIDGNATTTEASAQTEEGTDGKGSLLSTAGAAIAGTGAAIAGTGAAIASGTQNATTSAKNAVHDAASTAKDGVKNAASAIKDGAKNGAEAVKDGAKHAGSAVTLKERNVSGSKIKVALRDHQPTKAVKELVEEGSSSAKKHSNSTKKDTSTKKSTPTKKATSTKKAASTKTSAQLKNQHQSKSSNTSRKAASDRVVAKKSNTTSKRSASDRIVAKKSTKSSTGSIGATVSKLSHGFYIKVGTFKNTETAIKKIKKTGLNYKLVKTKDGKLTRVYIGKFNSKKSAQANLSKAKSVNVGAFIYEEK